MSTRVFRAALTAVLTFMMNLADMLNFSKYQVEWVFLQGQSFNPFETMVVVNLSKASALPGDF